MIKKILFTVFFVVANLSAYNFLSFDDPRSLTVKVKYALERGLAGIMAWQIAQDKTGVLSKAISDALPQGKEFIVYFPNYVLESRNYQVADLEKLLQSGVKITTIVYCFALPLGDGTVAFDTPEIDLGVKGKTVGLIRQLKNLKKKYPDLKLLLSLGGWKHKEGFFQAASNRKLKQLAFNSIKLIHDYGFDGIDIDWEYGSEQEFNAYVDHIGSFVNYLNQARQAINKPLKLVLAITPGSRFYTTYKTIKELSESVDQFYLMTYNYEGPWSEIAGHNAPLYSPNLPDKRKWATKEPKFESVDSSVQAFLAAGVKPKKLIMGVAYYGRCLKGVAQGQSYGLYEPHQGPGEAFTVLQPGTFDYANLKGVPLSHTENDQHSHWTYCWDHISQVPYLYGKQLEN